PDLVRERRCRWPSNATERLLQRLFELAKRALDLRGCAAAFLGRELAFAVERHGDAEQPLHHSVVNLACDVDPLPQLARPLALERRDAGRSGERCRLAQRPQQVVLTLAERRPALAIGKRNADPAAGCGERDADEGPAQERAEAFWHVVGRRRPDLDDL